MTGGAAPRRAGEASDPPEPAPIVQFGPLARRLGIAAAGLGVLGFVGLVLQGIADGLTFGLMAGWVALWLVAFALVAGALVAVHALGGAGRAQRSGERLGSPDVRLRPRRGQEG